MRKWDFQKKIFWEVSRIPPCPAEGMPPVQALRGSENDSADLSLYCIHEEAQRCKKINKPLITLRDEWLPVTASLLHTWKEATAVGMILRRCVAFWLPSTPFNRPHLSAYYSLFNSFIACFIIYITIYIALYYNILKSYYKICFIFLYVFCILLHFL